MERESIEEELIPTSTAIDGNINAMMPSGSASSITTVLLLSTAVAIAGSLSHGCATGYTSPVESGIMEDLDLSLAAYSLFGSIMTIGGAIGAIFSGHLADIMGRKRAMWFSEVFSASGWLAIAFAKDAWWLDIGRLLLGFGLGITSYVVPVYIAEIAPRNLRGGFTSAHQLMATSGFALVYLAGTLVSWRTLALLGFIPCIAQTIGLFFIPESPRWLAKVGREKDFESALQHLRGKNMDISEEAADIIDLIKSFLQDSEAKYLDLFQRRYVNSLVVVVGLMIFQQFGGISALAYYASSIFEDAGLPGSIGLQVLAVKQIPVAALALLLMDKCGRRPLLLVSAAGTCLSCFFIGLSFSLKGLPKLNEFSPILAIIGSAGYGTAYSIGMGGIPSVIMSEIFPLNVKASAGSLVTLVSWSCKWVTTYTFNFILEWSAAGTFYCFAGVGALTVLFIAKLVPETKGRTLEEIQGLISPLL